MNPLKTKKALIAIIFAGTIVFSNSLSLYALGINSRNEIILDNSDSTKIRAANNQTQNLTDKKKEIQKSKSTSNLTYNIIYYLISKIIKINPPYRHR